MRKIIFSIVLSFNICQVFGQVAVTANNSATTLAQTLVGGGVTISNATLNCGAAPAGSANYGSGVFTVTSSNIGMDSGIVLTSGRAATDASGNGVNGAVPGPSNATGNGADADLTAVIGGATFDKCILEFDFVTIGDTVKFDYVFGASEYTNWTCTNFNDVFGFFLSGPGIAGPYSNASKNIALVPGSTTCPVGVSTIYCPNSPGCCQTTNFCFGNTPGCGAFSAANNTCSYFVCNAGGTTIKYPGFTQVLTATSAVVPCSTYHIKLAIADKGDQILDSGVFLKAKSFSSDPIDLKVETGLSALNPYIIEGCDTAKLRITRQLYPNVPVTGDTVHFLITGSATNGVDYNFLADSIVFTGSGGPVATQPSDTTYSINLWAFNDGIAEGTEFIKVYVISGCFNMPTDSIIIEIRDSLGFSMTNVDTAICLGNSVSTHGIADVGIVTTWTPSTGVLNPNALNTTITPTSFGSQYYTVTGTYLACPPSVKGFNIITDPVPVITPMPDLEVCEGRTVDIHALVNPPFNYNLNWNPSSGLINFGGYDPTFVGTTTQNIDFTVVSPNALCTATDQFHVEVWPFAVGQIRDDTLACAGQPVQLWVSGGNPTAGYQWYPTTGLSCEFCPDPIASALGTTVYHAILLDTHGCMDTLDVTIENHPPFTMNLLNNDTTIYLGESVQINVEGNAPFIYWSPAVYLNYTQSSDPVATPLESITYKVTGVSLLNGCPIVDSFRINVIEQDVFIPNAFSPNGDGLNDVFKLTARKLINVQEYRIFNRWGQEIFSTKDIKQGWNGVYKGVPQDPGVYYYLIRVAYATGRSQFLKGEFTLIR